jgi:hypothetical protein
MATFDWPASFYPSAMEWGNSKSITQFTSPYSGAVQSIETGPERWVVSLSFPPRVWAKAAAVETFFERLSGGVNRVRLYHFTRPVPRGTMRGAPVVQTAAVRGATTLILSSTQPSFTLAAGDLFSAGGQLFKVAEDCAANISGVATVALVHRVRASISAGAAVVWDHPTADFIMPATGSKMGYSPIVSDPMSQIDFQEVW